MEGKIRVSGGVKRIEVNDEGEYISLPLGDDSFVLGFYRLLDEVKTSAEAVLGRSDGTDVPEEAAAESDKDEVSKENAVSEAERIIEAEKLICEKTDALFGEGTCKKVFGDILPGLDLFAEFFALLTPFFSEHKRERLKKLSKYDAERVGSSR